MPKDSKFKSCSKIDLCYFCNVARLKKQPVCNIKAGLLDFKNSGHFASIDFCARIWLCLPQTNFYNARNIIASRATFASTHEQHELISASIYLKFVLCLIFDKVWNKIKAYVAGFAIRVKKECIKLEHEKDSSIICFNAICCCLLRNVPHILFRTDIVG